MNRQQTSLVTFMLLLLFAGAADGLMDALGPTGFLLAGAAILGLAQSGVSRKATLEISEGCPVSYYRTCPYCGAHLDPGERCDCQDEQKASTDTDTTN